MLDCFYFALVTATTVGYGDFQPDTVEERAFATVYVLFSVLITTFALSNMVELVIDIDGDHRRETIKALLHTVTAATGGAVKTKFM